MTTLPQIPAASGGGAADLNALAALDANGLPMAPGEDERDYLQRLHAFADRMQKCRCEIDSEDGYHLDGMRLGKAQLVSEEIVRTAADRTEQAYGFRAEWVPAFFVDPKFHWLFGGCAYYSMPDMFVVVILRRIFANRRSWLFYDRDEILSHEMCHAARMVNQSRIFEERLAYKISQRSFRQRYGGMLHSPFDTLIALGSIFLLLTMQILRTFALPGLPIAPFWLLVALVLSFLFCRDLRYERILGSALNNLNLSTDHPRAVLFRCTDEEIMEIAKLADAEDLERWVEQAAAKELRWRVIKHRFWNVKT